MYHKPLLMELALQVAAWWREHPSEELPTPARLQAEIYRRFSAVARELATGTVVTREKWVAYLAPSIESVEKQLSHSPFCCSAAALSLS